MPEMKAMEFTDKLNLQPVRRPVLQLVAQHDQVDSRARILTHRGRIRCTLS